MSWSEVGRVVVVGVGRSLELIRIRSRPCGRRRSGWKVLIELFEVIKDESEIIKSDALVGLAV